MFKHKKNISLVGIALIAVFLTTAGFGCKTQSSEVQEALKPVTLKYWRVWDDKEAFDEIIANYKALHPNIKIEYKKFRYEEYEKELLEAFAEDRGPDIFSIPQSWLRKYQPKLQPMPDSITMAYQEIKGTVKKEIIVDLRTQKTPSQRKLRELYPDVVYKNIVIDDNVWGLPLSLETLIMLYNRDMLNRAGVAQVPASWKEFQEAVSKISSYSSDGTIRQAGVAMGTGSNVSRSSDIISLLMMQNGAMMTGANKAATFFNKEQDGYNPGMEAVRFYTDFASPLKNVYSWNADIPNSLEAFMQGKVGFIFAYNYDLPTIRSRAPRLNFGVAPVPQVNSDRPANYASYWVETVSKKSANSNEAWDFLIFATTNAKQAKTFLQSTERPTALKELINDQTQDDDLYAASTQTLTADNWYQGKNAPAAETALKDMLDMVAAANNEDEIKYALTQALQKINQTL